MDCTRKEEAHRVPLSQIALAVILGTTLGSLWTLLFWKIPMLSTGIHLTLLGVGWFPLVLILVSLPARNGERLKTFRTSNSPESSQ